MKNLYFRYADANWLETVATRYTQSPNHDLCCRLLSHIPLLAAYTGWPAEKHLRCNPAAKTWPFQTKTCSKLVGAEETAGDFSWTPSEEDKQFIEKTVTSLVRREDLCRLLVVAMAIELERLTSCAERGETGHQLDANGANWPPKHNDKWSVDSSALDLTVDGDTAEVGHSGNRDFRKSQRTSPEMFEVFGSEQVAGNVQLLGDGDDSCDGGRRSLLPLGAEMPQQDVRGGESGDGAHSETHTVFKDGSTLVPDSLDNTSSTSFPATLSAEAPLPDIEANIFEGEAPDWFSQESCKEVQIKSLYAELAEAENADVPPSAQCFAQCCASRGRRPEAKHNNASSEWQNLEARSFDSRRSIADTPPAHPCLDLTPLKTKAHPLAKCAENDCKTTSMITPAEFRADYHAAGENKAEEHNRFEHRTVFGTHGESLGTRTGTPAKHEGSTTERDVHDDCRVMFRPRRSALPVPVRTYNSISRAPTSASPVSVAGSSRTHADVTQSAVGRDRNQRPTATDVKRAVRRKTVAV